MSALFKHMPKYNISHSLAKRFHPMFQARHKTECNKAAQWLCIVPPRHHLNCFFFNFILKGNRWKSSARAVSVEEFHARPILAILFSRFCTALSRNLTPGDDLMFISQARISRYKVVLACTMTIIGQAFGLTRCILWRITPLLTPLRPWRAGWSELVRGILIISYLPVNIPIRILYFPFIR